MKKIVATLLFIALIFSVIPSNVFATLQTNDGGIDISEYTNSELDLTQYTIQDIQNMSSEEYLELVYTFERVYDPYDSYVEPTLNNIVEINLNDNVVEPQWKSGEITDGEWTEVGCHEYITMVACNVLSNDKGFYSNNASNVVAITLLISLASLLPDEDENNSNLFTGHFYNPITGCNYLLQTDNTARTNAVAHYEDAVEAANNGNMNLAYEHLGRCLHYVQDVCEPHHAYNITGANASHSAFETFAYEHQEEYIGEITTLTYEEPYYWALVDDVGEIIYDAGMDAVDYARDVNNALIRSKWAEVAEICLQNAVKYSTMVMYKFGQETSVPFV